MSKQGNSHELDVEIGKLADALDSLDYFVVFLGAGASMEGIRNGERFPGFGKLCREVLKKAGKDISEEEGIQSDNLKGFIAYIREQENSSKYLKKYLDGEPGAAHYHLASLSCAITRDFSIKTIFLTTNYDDLIEKALKEVGADPEILSLRFDSVEDEKIIDSANRSLDRGRPVVMHLLGDLHDVSPALYQEEINRLSGKAKHFLLEWLSKRVVVIGYSMQDDCIKQLFFDSNTTLPVHLIDPQPVFLRPYNSTDRVIPIEKRFGDFVMLLLSKIYQEAEVKHQNNHHDIMKKSYEAHLKGAESPELLYNFDFFQWRTGLLNKFSAQSVLQKISNKKSMDFSSIYLDRKLLDWDSFLSDRTNLAVIIGNAGIGKSCYMYMNADHPPTDTIPLLILPETIRGSFKHRLAETYLCPDGHVETLMHHFNGLLSQQGKYLLILVDAINEVGDKKGRSLKTEIEEFFYGKNWTRIKLVYTCRSYYWDSCIPASQKRLIAYHSANTFNLEAFSDEQLRIIFEKYKAVYGFRGEWDILSPDFREKLKEPLLLRLLAEAYQAKQIPRFAPAVKVYSAYIHSLEENDPKKGERNLKRHLVEIGRYYWLAGTVTGSMSVQERDLELFLSRRFGLNPLEGLFDANVIYEEGGMIQFFSERFFEFVLGLALIEQEQWLIIPVSAASIFEKWKVCRHRSYSFTFGLKSALIYLSIENSGDPHMDLLTDEERLKTLLGLTNQLPMNDTKKAEFRSFVLLVMRELLTETEFKKDNAQNGYQRLKNIVGDNEFERIILAIGSDDSRSLPYQVDFIFREDREKKRKVAFNFINLIRDPKVLEEMEEQVRDKFTIESVVDIKGLFYLLPVYFEHHNIFKTDPTAFLRNTLKQAMQNKNAEQQNRYTMQLGTAILELDKEEGPMFFGGAEKDGGIGYIWSMADAEKRKVADLSRLFANVPTKLTEADKKVIYFFGSELRYWKDLDSSFGPGHKKIRRRRWEYFMAKWIVVMLAKKSGFAPVLEFLQYCIKANLWLGLDFALCTMEHVLCTVFEEDMEIQELGISKMKKWVQEGEEHCPEYFYYRLNEADPLQGLFNPLSQIAGAQVVMNPTSNLIFLDECLQSENSKKMKLALLSLRKVARVFPDAGMRSLKIAWDMRNNDTCDEQYRYWLCIALKELGYRYPKLVEDLLTNKLRPTNEERAAIDRVNANVESNEYKINSFCQWLSMDTSARNLSMDWYDRMLHSHSISDFCNEVARKLIMD